MDGYLSNKLDNFVDDPEKLCRLSRREAQQAKKLDFVDSKSEDQGSSKSPKNSPPQSSQENRLPPMGDQPQEREIGELCTPDIIDLPILNLAEIGRPFEIKTSKICMVQQSPFTGKEDPNLHLQAFIQLCQTFNMDGVTQDQMRARLFMFTLLGKALQRGDSRSNEGKAFYVHSTWESFAMVPLSTGGDGARLECFDKGLHKEVLLTG
jgi:hypothetical protein